MKIVKLSFLSVEGVDGWMFRVTPTVDIELGAHARLVTLYGADAGLYPGHLDIRRGNVLEESARLLPQEV